MTQFIFGETIQSEKVSKPDPGLYIVATPIGNLRDVTLRALDILRAADVIACEDTRITGRLLKAYGIEAASIPYHDHNAARARPGLIKRLERGEIVALVSDAGTPLVSDPGFKLVEACAKSGIAVYAVPGASALLAGLGVAGLPTDRFYFAGFLPSKQAARRKALREIAAVPGTLVIYESARRLAASLADMAAVLGDRRASVARELTKRFEEVVRGSLTKLATRYAESGPPKGEIVVIVAPPDPPEIGEEMIDRALTAALERQSVKDAAGDVAAALGLPRRRLYERALALSGKRGPAK
ncbi:MAG: 16S rRNA (cytidine(1402)-2'-O)-methyltransferase [Alphaproteobacteria bacterium]|nr:16S rRNA (cytidine(1402)-2'-O)-methyltransferase [Alphaproteobacteria bacterium]